MTGFGGVKKAVEAMRLGAGDYLAKPFEPEELPLPSRAAGTSGARPGATSTGRASMPSVARTSFSS